MLAIHAGVVMLAAFESYCDFRRGLRTDVHLLSCGYLLVLLLAQGWWLWYYVG